MSGEVREAGDAAVVSLTAAREAREADSGEHLACQDCGCVWWLAKVVIDKASMSVTGYEAALVCAECAMEATDG